MKISSRHVMVPVVLLSAMSCANRGMHAPAPPTPVATVVNCTVARGECTAESLGPNGPQCDNFQTVNLVGTACSSDSTQPVMDAACVAAFCTRQQANPLVAYDFQPCTVTGAAADPANLPYVGTCVPLPAGSPGTASISYQIHQRGCVVGEVDVCDSFTDDSTSSPPVPANCVDLTALAAMNQVPITSSDRDIVPHLTQVIPNDPRCTPATSPLAYDLTPGPLGQASAAGTTVPFSLKRGSAVFNGNQLTALSLNIVDLTVSGTQLTNVRVTNTLPAPLKVGDPDNPSHTGIAAKNLNLVAIGLANGAPQIYHLQNDTDLDLIKSSTTLKLSGTFHLTDIDASGTPLPVTVSVTLPGTPATPPTSACATASARDRLFGFEDPQSWSSTVGTLSLVTSPITQGCGALGVSGQGFIPINSTPFTTAGLTLKPAVSVDLFIPNNQPNQFYLGALQMYLTCPSANANNEYIGQVELTGKPQNAYSTLRFPLPAQVIGTLNARPSDCSWGFALNVNQTNRTWILDNLRFTN